MGHAEDDDAAAGRSLLRPGDDGSARRGGCRRALTEWAAESRLAASYLRASLRRDHRSWSLGVATIALVVAFSAILQAAIETSPVLFLKLAEGQAGETDVTLTPELSADAALPFINWTGVDAALAASPASAGLVTGTAPRWLLLASVASKAQPARSTSAVVLAIDSDQEAAIGLGRAWDRRRLGEEEAYVAASALLETGVSAGRGERIVATFDVAAVLGSISAGSSAAGTNDVTGTTGSSATSGGGSSGSANASSLVSAEVAAALLRAAGVDGSTSTTVDGATALAIALQAAGLGGGNASAIATALPGLSLVRVDLAPLLAGALGTAAASLQTLTAEYSVLDAIGSDPGGKYPSLLGNVVVVEAEQLAAWVRATLLAVLARARLQLAPLLGLAGTTSPAAGLADSVDAALARLESGAGNFTYAVMRQYAMTVSVQARRRLAYYLYDPSDDLDANVAGFAGAVTAGLGDAAPVAGSTALGDTLSQLRLLGLFLNQIFYIVIAVLVGLSTLVIYALVAGDLEAKTYELGMLRALGMRTATLGQLLGLTTVAFALPGLAVGLGVASLVNVAIVYGVGWYASLPPASFLGGGALPPSAWGLAVGLGALVPAAAVVLPIGRALSSNLRDALDLYHSAINAVSVTLTRLRGSWGVSPSVVGVGALLTVAGLATFIVLPQAFLSSDLAVFLGLLAAVLIAMLLGLTLVALSVQGQVEAAVLAVLTGAWTEWAPLLRLPGAAAARAAFPDRRLHTLAAKHLAGHRARNGQTAGMVAVTTAFLVFASALFALQGASIVTNVRMIAGGDIVVYIPDWLIGWQLPQRGLADFLARSQATSDAVTAFTWVSLPLTHLPFVRTTRLANLVGLPRSTTRVFGVQSNLLEATFSEYAIVTEAVGAGLEGLPPGAGAGLADSSSAGTGGDAATRFAYAHPVRALYLGAGALRLPVEALAGSGAGGYPAPLASGEWASPLYVCGQDVAAAVEAAAAADGTATVTATGGSWDPSLGWAWTPGSGQQWPPFIDAAAGGPYRTVWDSVVPGPNGSTDVGAALLTVHAARSSASSSPRVRAYLSYDYCMLACADRTPAAAALVNATGSQLLGAACAATTALVAVNATSAAPANASYAYYGPWVLPSGGVLSSAPGPQAPCNDTSGGGAAGFPRACVAGSQFDRGGQARDVAATYGRYVDVLMSESVRSGASLDTATPLQLRLTLRDPATGDTEVVVYLAKARAMAKKVPGFFFSSYSTLGGRAPVLVRMRDYARLLQDAKEGYYQLSGTTPTPTATPVGGGGGSSPPAVTRPWPPAPMWVPSSPAWLLAGLPRAVSFTTPAASNASVATWAPSGGGPAVVYGAVGGWALDANASTLLVAPTATGGDTATAPPGSLAGAGKLNATGAVTLTLDLGRCALVSGVRLAGWPFPPPPGAHGNVTTSLYALSDAAAGGYKLVAGALTWSAAGTGGGALVTAEGTAFTPFSARYWALVVRPDATAAGGAPGPSQPLAVPDVASLRLTEPPLGACLADDLSPDDALPPELAPKQRLIVRLKRDATSDDRQRALNGLRSAVGASGGGSGTAIRVQDVASLLDSASLALVGLDVFFIVVAAIALALCFFAAWLSFTATVSEASVELGIMRALGLSSAQVTRVFVYEALAVVVAAFITGAAVGVAIAVSLSLQLGLFLELPFRFTFPYAVFVFQLVGCLVLAVVASALPARRLSRLHIANVLKGRTE